MIPSAVSANPQATDAIVVLTGGGLRLERGFELLSQGRAKRMFVSGVEDGVTLPSLLHKKEYRAWAGKIDPASVTFGYKARSTTGNAEETAEWIAGEHIKSIRLVTGNYHMPRSVYELQEAAPHLIIISEPVFPKPFDHNAWWQSADGTRLVISEYNKYLATMLRHAAKEMI